MDYVSGSLLAALYVAMMGVPTTVVMWIERDEGHCYVTTSVAAILGIVPSVVFYLSTPYPETFVSAWGKVLLWATASCVLFATSFFACILSERRDARKDAFTAPMKEIQRLVAAASLRDVFIRKAIAREDYTEASRLKEGGAWSVEDWKALRT